MIPRFNIFYNEAGDAGGGGGGGSGGSGAAGADAGQAGGAQGGNGSGGGSTTLLGNGNGGAAQGAAGSDAGGAAGTQAAGAAKGAWGGLVSEDGSFAQNWWEKDPDLKEHGAHFSKYKGVKDALRHTLNLQQLLGSKADAVIIPGPDSPPDVVARFREKLGVPENPAGYGIKPPDNLPEGLSWDQERVDTFAKLAHDLSLSPQQVKALQDWDLSNLTGQVAKTKEGMIAIEKAELAKQGEALKKAWGNGQEATKNESLAIRAALTAGFTSEELGLVEGKDGDPIFRNAKVVMAFAKLGGLMSEDSLAKGAGDGGYKDGKAEGLDIINNPQNPYYKKYHAGDETVRAMVQGYLRQ
jgi:hypothetical protein